MTRPHERYNEPRLLGTFDRRPDRGLTERADPILPMQKQRVLVDRRSNPTGDSKLPLPFEQPASLPIPENWNRRKSLLSVGFYRFRYALDTDRDTTTRARDDGSRETQVLCVLAKCRYRTIYVFLPSFLIFIFSCIAKKLREIAFASSRSVTSLRRRPHFRRALCTALFVIRTILPSEFLFLGSRIRFLE